MKYAVTARFRVKDPRKLVPFLTETHTVYCSSASVAKGVADKFATCTTKNKWPDGDKRRYFDIRIYSLLAVIREGSEPIWGST